MKIPTADIAVPYLDTEQMMEVVQAQPGLCNQAGEGLFSERPDWRAETKFERRGKRLGHGVWDLIFCREGTLPVTQD